MSELEENHGLNNPEEELEESYNAVDEGTHESSFVNPEEALELAAEGFEVTHSHELSINEALSPNGHGHKLAYAEGEHSPKKDAKQLSNTRFDSTLSQKRRREMTLEWQKKRRDEILDKIRQLETDSGVSDSEPEDMDFLEIARKKKSVKLSDKSGDSTSTAENGDQEGATSSKGRRGKAWNAHHSQKRSAPCSVMLSEWLLEKPANFEEDWVGVLCPVGKRTLVVASRGKTRVFTRTNHYLGHFQSMLPGGRKVSYSVLGNRGRGVTILDCFWSEESQIFYVLDLICWNSHSCSNCDTEYRQFFLMSKFYENPELLAPSPTNPIPFMPLPFFKADTLPTIMTSIYPPFPEKIDGILFFHKEAFYITETNPLCLWVLLSDVPTRLSIDVNPELLERENKPVPKKKKKDVKMSMEVQQ